MYADVRVRDWMTGSPITIEPMTPISMAHQIMKKNSIRRLPVVKDGRLAGIVTIGDIREASPSDATTLSIWELNYLWAQLTVEKVMSRSVVSTTPDTPILDAAEQMLDHKISGLPVVEDGAVVGIITETDIFRMLIKQRNQAPTV